MNMIVSPAHFYSINRFNRMPRIHVNHVKLHAKTAYPTLHVPHASMASTYRQILVSYAPYHAKPALIHRPNATHV